MWRKEAEEGAEEVPPTPEEAEEGPGPLATLDKDASLEGGPAWGTLRSSTNPAVKHQVRLATGLITLYNGACSSLVLRSSLLQSSCVCHSSH